MRNLNPCGDLLSFMAAVQTNLDNVGQVTVPVLVLAGEDDAFCPPPAIDQQAALFTGSDDVTTVEIPDTGHALTLHRSGDAFSAAVADWLADLEADAPVQT